MYTDNQLIDFINMGLSDEDIMKMAHGNAVPSDLYGAVAEVVTLVLHDDPVMMQTIKGAQEGSPAYYLKQTIQRIISDELMKEVKAWWEVMGISRKDTKKIVMTYLYGSTEYGNRDSIQERIDERADECLEKALDPYFDRSGADVWKEHRSKAVTVMVRLTRGAMGIVCPSTVKTMDLIQGWAVTLGAQDKPLKVRNMLGFSFYQDNPNLEVKRVEIWENGKRVMNMQYRVPASDGKRLNEKKMKAGSAPNLVHDHDACHLMLSTVKCADSIEGKPFFHHIHDSMSTQCADTPALAHSIREAFCDMYADKDVLRDIWELNGGHDNYLAEPPVMGELDVREVMNSHYFFS
jgi:DNA-directed RNA polymerase